MGCGSSSKSAKTYKATHDQLTEATDDDEFVDLPPSGAVDGKEAAATSTSSDVNASPTTVKVPSLTGTSQLSTPLQGSCMEEESAPKVVGFLSAEAIAKEDKMSSPTQRSAGDFAKYQQRKEQRKAKQQKKAQTLGSLGLFVPQDGFLSNVPETNHDVQYRFAFIVICDFAVKVVEAICSSTEARAYSTGLSDENEESLLEDLEEEPLSESPVSSKSAPHPRQRSSSFDGATSSPKAHSPVRRNSTNDNKKAYISGIHRCVCPVPYPWSDKKTGEELSKPKLLRAATSKYAKLGLRPLTFSQRVPTFDGTLEASNTAFVFVILVDPGEASPSLQKQLDDLLKTIKVFKRAPRELRPKWAVIFCHSEKQPECPEEGDDPWAAAIDNFDRIHGPLWRFGSMHLEDSNMLYASFCKIASQRIYANQHPEVELDEPHSEEGSNASSELGGAAGYYSAEREEEERDDLARKPALEE